MTAPAMPQFEVVGAWYPGPGWAVLEGDSLELLRTLPTGCAQMIFADPPYFLSNGGTTNSGGRRTPVRKGGWDESAGIAADHQFHRRWLQACRRVLSPAGTLWVSGTHHAIFSVGWALQSAGWYVLNMITWHKTNAPPNLSCRHFTHSSEMIIWAAPEHVEPLPHTFNYADMKKANGGKQMRDLWQFTSGAPTRERKLWPHPTQKPEVLLDRVVRASTRPGDLVVDPFCGSGTTGAAALALGRRFIGIELDAGYAKLAAGRCAAACSRAGGAA